jgi:protein-S-isoprenylcysteine O-methyltransferase Ste14
MPEVPPALPRRSIFVNGLTVAAVAAGILLFYKPLHSSEKSALTDWILDAVGLAIILAGQYLRACARGYKSERHLEDVSLVTDGPYELVRNPMYLASFLIGSGIVLMILKPWMVPPYVLFFVVWYRPQIRNEEERLARKFGPEYAEYRRRTPCVLPRARALLGIRRKTHLPLRLSWLKREWNTILSWAIVVLLVEGFEDLRAYGTATSLEELVLLLSIVAVFAIVVYLGRERSQDPGQP